MTRKLNTKNIGLIVANGFDEIQMTGVQKKLSAQGATLKIISPELGLVSGYSEAGWGLNFPVESILNETLSSDYDMLIVLDGEKSIQRLQQSAHTKRIVNNAYASNIPVVLLGHAVVISKDLDDAKDLIVSVNESLEPLFGGSSIELSFEPITVSGSIISGLLNEEDSSILDHAIEMLLSSVETQKVA